MSDSTKICIKCKSQLPMTSEYYKVIKQNKCGFSGKCKKCLNEDRQEWRKKQVGYISKEERFSKTLEERFWDKVDVKTENECWEWKASLTLHGGYGQLMNYKNGKRILIKAHQFSYKINKGENSNGLMVCHKCNNSKCCNPNHLYLGTAKDNWNDTTNCGHNYKLPPVRPEKVHCAKINFEIATIIRNSDENGVVLSKKYGISKTMISKIKRGLSWKVSIQ